MTLQRILLNALCAALAFAASPSRAADPAFQWPGKAKAAVSLAYDDALDSQLDNAIPSLDKFGLKGSFYLQLSNPSVGTIPCSTSAPARRRAASSSSRTATSTPPPWPR
jgi:hypothetical protein